LHGLRRPHPAVILLIPSAVAAAATAIGTSAAAAAAAVSKAAAAIAIAIIAGPMLNADLASSRRVVQQRPRPPQRG
jgi:hypothetical protein